MVVIAGRCRITNRGRITIRSSIAPLPLLFLDISLDDGGQEADYELDLVGIEVPEDPEEQIDEDSNNPPFP